MREIRQAHNYTQQEMADKLGCALPTIKRSEKDGRLPRSGAVLRNLKALGTLAGIAIEAETTA